MTPQDVMQQIESAVNRIEDQEVEQATITSLVNQGVSREMATRIVYSKGTEYSENDIREAQQTFKSKPFQLLR